MTRITGDYFSVTLRKVRYATKWEWKQFRKITDAYFQITVTCTKSFLDYIRSQPIVFEVFGHYQQHPLHKDAKLEGSVRQPPRRMLPPSIPISQPVRSSKFGALPSPCTAHIHAKVRSDALNLFSLGIFAL